MLHMNCVPVSVLASVLLSPICTMSRHERERQRAVAAMHRPAAHAHAHTHAVTDYASSQLNESPSVADYHNQLQYDEMTLRTLTSLPSTSQYQHFRSADWHLQHQQMQVAHLRSQIELQSFNQLQQRQSQSTQSLFYSPALSQMSSVADLHHTQPQSHMQMQPRPPSSSSNGRVIVRPSSSARPLSAMHARTQSIHTHRATAPLERMTRGMPSQVEVQYTPYTASTRHFDSDVHRKQYDSQQQRQRPRTARQQFTQAKQLYERSESRQRLLLTQFASGEWQRRLHATRTHDAHNQLRTRPITAIANRPATAQAHAALKHTLVTSHIDHSILPTSLSESLEIEKIKDSIAQQLRTELKLQQPMQTLELLKPLSQSIIVQEIRRRVAKELVNDTEAKTDSSAAADGAKPNQIEQDFRRRASESALQASIDAEALLKARLVTAAAAQALKDRHTEQVRLAALKDELEASRIKTQQLDARLATLPKPLQSPATANAAQTQLATQSAQHSPIDAYFASFGLTDALPSPQRMQDSQSVNDEHYATLLQYVSARASPAITRLARPAQSVALDDQKSNAHKEAKRQVIALTSKPAAVPALPLSSTSASPSSSAFSVSVDPAPGLSESDLADLDFMVLPPSSAPTPRPAARPLQPALVPQSAAAIVNAAPSVTPYAALLETRPSHSSLSVPSAPQVALRPSATPVSNTPQLAITGSRLPHSPSAAAWSAAADESNRSSPVAGDRPLLVIAAQVSPVAESVSSMQSDASSAVVRPICDLCDEAESSLRCTQCRMNLCQSNGCDEGLHQPSNMKHHERVAF